VVRAARGWAVVMTDLVPACCFFISGRDGSGPSAGNGCSVSQCGGLVITMGLQTTTAAIREGMRISSAKKQMAANPMIETPVHLRAT